jgi:hypothetical protein
VPEDVPEATATPALTRADLDDGRPWDRRRKDVIGVAVLIAVGVFIAGFVVGRSTADGTPALPLAGTGGLAPETPEADPFAYPVGDADRTTYWGFAGITAAVTDDFDRADDPEELGRADGGTWESVRGTWGIDSGTAVAVPGDAERPGLAVIRGGPAARLTEVTFTTIEPGAGLVFRYLGPEDYWALVVGADGETWDVLEVAGGRLAFSQAIRVTPRDGVTVAVSQRPEQVRVHFDGQFVAEIPEPGGSSTRSGLLAPVDGDGTARWDRFFVGELPSGVG